MKKLTSNSAQCCVAACCVATPLRGVWGRMDTCICIVESLCCIHATTQHCLLISYTPIQNKKLKKKERKKKKQRPRKDSLMRSECRCQSLMKRQPSLLPCRRDCILPLRCLVASNSWDPMECRPPGSSVHGIFQARILEWVVTSFSRGSSWPRDQACVSYTGRQILYHGVTRKATT